MIGFWSELSKRVLATFRQSIPAPAGDATQRFGKLIATCPVCQRSLQSHAYHVMATAIAKSQTVVHLKGAILRRDWKSARLYEWDAERDSFQLTIVNCPNSPRLGLVETLHPFELMSNPRVEFFETLTEQESEILRAEIADDWAFF